METEIIVLAFMNHYERVTPINLDLIIREFNTFISINQTVINHISSSGGNYELKSKRFYFPKF